MKLTIDDLLIKNNFDVAYCAAVYQGLPVFPVCGDVDAKDKDGKPFYKIPLVSGGFKSATTNHNQVKAWFTKHPDAMVGIPTGSVTGIGVIDIDVKNGVDGFKSLEELENQLGVLPETYTIETPSGGQHRQYHLPDGIELSGAVGIAPAIDTRFNGGYIILEGSKNSLGEEYKAICTSSIATLPEKWIEFLKNRKSKNSILDKNGFIAEGTRNNSMAKVIGTFRGLGHEGQSLWELSKDYNQKHCKPPLDEAELIDVFVSIGSRDRGYTHTPIGNGERFADRYANNVKCINGKGNATTWMVWDGVKWSEDKLACVKEYSKIIAEELQVEAVNLPDSDEMKAIKSSLFAHAKLTMNNPHKTLTMACSHPKIAVSADLFDTHDYIIPCRSGYVDLKTVEHHAHDNTLLYTHIVNASYNPDAVCEEWRSYIKFFTGNDPEVEAFLARLYGGLGLIGDNPEQKAIFLLGRAKNGKSTLHNIIQGIMPDYSDVLRTEVLAARGNKDFRQDIADLMDARFVAANELPQNSKINGALFKAITGGDITKGRQNYQDSQKFKPKGLISLTSNWEPQMDDGDEGLERRVIVYRNNDQVTKRDTNLADKIIANPDAVFMWLLKGRMDYIKCCKEYEQGLIDDPLKTPQKVIDMTEGYLNRRNTFRAFLIDKCLTGDISYSAQAKPFYDAYHIYCITQGFNGNDIINEKTFYEVVDNKFSKKLGNGRSYYVGVKLKDS